MFSEHLFSRTHLKGCFWLYISVFYFHLKYFSNLCDGFFNCPEKDDEQNCPTKRTNISCDGYICNAPDPKYCIKKWWDYFRYCYRLFNVGRSCVEDFFKTLLKNTSQGKQALVQVVSCEFWEIFYYNFFIEQLRTTSFIVLIIYYPEQFFSVQNIS